MAGSRKALTLADREEISRGLAEGVEQQEIAARLGRCPSVISREIARHGGRHGYRAHRAQRRAGVSRRRPQTRKLDGHPRLRAVVLPLLEKGWSPEQVAGRLPLDYPGDDALRVSHETVYQWIYALPKGELERTLIALRSGRTARKPRTGRVPKAPRISGVRWIDERPADAAGRQTPGHWEGDLIIGKAGASAAGTLVERTSRFLVMVSVPARDAKTVSGNVIEKVRDLPGQLRRTLTWDCGAEMAEHAAVTLATDMDVYFAHPHSPWERGTNENTNRWIREYFPKGTEITDDQAYLDSVAADLNDRPRRILGFRKPSEVFAEMINDALASTG